MQLGIGALALGHPVGCALRLLLTSAAASWQPQPMAVSFQSLEPATYTLSCLAAADNACMTLAALRVSRSTLQLVQPACGAAFGIQCSRRHSSL